MQYGIEESTSELVVFIDADVRLSNDAIARAVTTLQDLNLNFISAYPMQVAKTWSEKLIQPLLQWSWMSSVPLRISEKSKNPAFCVANGQFFVVERQALRKIEDLYRIRSAVLDDIFLARELVRSGFHGTVIDGSKIASCRMYSSWSELREGYGKSLHTAFGSIFGTAIAISLFLLTGVLPLASAFFGSKIGLAAFFAITATRALSAITSRGKMWHCILHPFSMLLLIYLLIRSWVKRNHVLWKGRPV
jgi:cellulose synthase/poly-beta-1,6-N-acetylglucosamine synthase-like glycosyltransferase